jgi:hypothetical protein
MVDHVSTRRVEMSRCRVVELHAVKFDQAGSDAAIEDDVSSEGVVDLTTIEHGGGRERRNASLHRLARLESLRATSSVVDD